ncbi:hypothetical protein KDM87_01825 [Undibacterium sp. FT147W]|uniref:Uncharacterized protein n=1 Tax=Undibacterium rivi TaxID=2828729 RepID=A0ABS5GXZ1_9BURK|nr:hypothetical protein [Undibacterium rivi]MBR7791321.1 hypothetical protein [Undibacterium rivi]
MYLWNTRSLVEDLKRGPLPEQEQLKYFLFSSALAAMSAATPSDATQATLLPAWAAIVTEISFVMLGIIWCYRSNAAGDNRDFVARFLALHVPIGLRLSALIFVVSIPLVAILGPAFLIDLYEKAGAVGVVATGALFSFIFYWRVNVRIREISHVG